MTKPRRRSGDVRPVVAALAAAILTLAGLATPALAEGSRGGASGAAQVASAGPAAGAPADKELTARQVIEKVRSAVKTIRDARARIEAEAIDGRGRRTRSVVAASLVRQPGVVRLEIVEPAALADQVYVIDFEGRRLSVYLPVTHQILVQSLDQALPKGADPRRFGPDSLLGDWAPAEADRLSLAAVENRGGRRYYVLEAPAPEAPEQPSGSPGEPGGSGVGPFGTGVTGMSGFPFLTAQQAAVIRLWVNGSTWLVERVVAYDGAGKAIGSVVFEDLRINVGLRPAELRRLPEDAEVVES